MDLNDSDWSPALPDGCSQTSSLLNNPHIHHKRVSDAPSPFVYSIDAGILSKAMDHLASQPLPDPSNMFPWLHGLHPDNQMQLNFFSSRKKVQRKPPKHWRGITLVKLGDMEASCLKNSVPPQEVLTPHSSFLNPDPPRVFSVRNFQIQAAKMAALSDIVVYGDEGCCQEELMALAQEFALAQEEWRYKHDPAQDLPWYNTFILSSKLKWYSCRQLYTNHYIAPFSEIETDYPNLISISRDRVPQHTSLEGGPFDFRKSKSILFIMTPSANNFTSSIVRTIRNGHDDRGIRNFQ